jgi:hypothetical protein
MDVFLVLAENIVHEVETVQTEQVSLNLLIRRHLHRDSQPS